MFEQLQDGIGLEVVIWLQAHGNGLFDALATLLHVMGLNLVQAIAIVLTYGRGSRRLGMRLLVAHGLAIVLIYILKNVFQTPRPFQAHPDLVRALIPQLDYGIPSGHVLTAVVIWGYLALWFGRRWWYGLAAVYVLLMAWSRLYAGVHYPQDVVAGVGFGVALLGLYWRVSGRVMSNEG
jgi:membrane-associated phospholipid phosphatase